MSSAAKRFVKSALVAVANRFAVVVVIVNLAANVIAKARIKIKKNNFAIDKLKIKEYNLRSEVG